MRSGIPDDDKWVRRHHRSTDISALDLAPCRRIGELLLSTVDSAGILSRSADSTMSWQVGQALASGRRTPSWYRKTDINLRDDAGVVAELRRLGGTESRALADPEVLGLPFIEPYVYIRGPPLRLSCYCVGW